MNTPFVWQGRVDTEEPGDSTRWHQRVQAFDAASHDGVALIGFAVDEGVRRNGGRPGAAQGPHALRGALANMPVLGEPALWDAGDVACPDAATDDALDTAQEALCLHHPRRYGPDVSSFRRKSERGVNVETVTCRVVRSCEVRRQA